MCSCNWQHAWSVCLTDVILALHQLTWLDVLIMLQPGARGQLGVLQCHPPYVVSSTINNYVVNCLFDHLCKWTGRSHWHCIVIFAAHWAFGRNLYMTAINVYAILTESMSCVWPVQNVMHSQYLWVCEGICLSADDAVWTTFGSVVFMQHLISKLNV